MTFRDFATLESNVEAAEASLAFATAKTPFVAIVGPSGCGKSHLLQAVSQYLAVRDSGVVNVYPVEYFLANQSRLETPAPLILDDAQVVFTRPKYRVLLRFALERRVRSGRPTMIAFTSAKPVRRISALIPNPRQWTTAEILSPSRADREILVEKLTKNEDVQVSTTLIKVLADRVNGNGRTYLGALRRLKLTGYNWIDRHSVLRACGVLDPFFTDNTSWDLRHQILREAQRQRSKFPGLRAEDLAVYTMMREAKLCESKVAQFIGKEPADVYLITSRFDRMVQNDDLVKPQVRHFIDCVIDGIVK